MFLQSNIFNSICHVSTLINIFAKRTLYQIEIIIVGDIKLKPIDMSRINLQNLYCAWTVRVKLRFMLNE